MNRYKFSSLKKIVNAFSRKKVLVVGDLLLDRFIWGDVSRISPEAPVPVVTVRKEGHMPGGACNVASNLVSVGSNAVVAGVCGDDAEGELLKECIRQSGMDDKGAIMDPSRPTTVKTRVIAHQQQVVRIDREDFKDLAGEYTDRIVKYVRGIIGELDALIIEDYGKGVVTPRLIKKILPLARKYGKLVAVDPKENHFSYYKGADLITPNHHEASRAAGLDIGRDRSIEEVGEKLLRKLGSKVVLITQGEEGMMVFRKSKAPKRIPTLAKEVYDVSGAGDTVIAVYTLAMISGASPIGAAHIANCAAGIVVGKMGVATVTEQELLRRLREETDGRD